MTEAVSNLRQIVSRANELLQEIAAARRERAQLEANLKMRVEVLQHAYGGSIDTLKQTEETLVDELIELVSPRFRRLVRKGTQTIFLRHGQVAYNKGSEKVEIAEGVTEEVIIKRIAREGGLREYTSLGKRSIRRSVLVEHPDFVARIKDLSIVRRPRFIIRLPKVQGQSIEIKKDASHISVELPKED
jgi:phage host-nuclease inhibitor protein Gam